MTHALQGIDYEPTVIGIDLPFLVDGSDSYFRVMTIGEMVEMIEADVFYPDEPGRMAGATVYRLQRGRLPQTMAVAYRIYRYSEEWIYKTMEINAPTGELVAQKGYMIPTLKGYEKWSKGN